nr:cupin domain-containing protein [Hyphomonas sp. Mor2]
MKKLDRTALVCLSSIGIMACASSSSAEDTTSAAEPKPALLIERGEGEQIDFPLHPVTRLAGADSNLAGLSLFEIMVPANSAGAPPHTHTHEDEFFYVREGTVTFMADGEQKTISPGGLVMLPRGGAHAMWNAGDVDATLLVGTSQGEFDDFFDAVAMEVAAAGDLAPPEIGAIVGRIGAERGILIDMSLVPDDVRPLYGMPPEEQ